MSVAYKCDRCGAFYTETDFKGPIKFFGIIHPDIKAYDLCPSCFSFLQTWLEDEGKPTYITTGSPACISTMIEKGEVGERNG